MSSSRPVVLFVDDEARILRSLRLLFRQRAEVLATTSGTEALQWVGEREIDVVVSDQRMPGMTGVELLREVRRRSPRSMRILLTGYADLSAIVASVNEGEIFRFVEKPWEPQHLLDVVEQAARVARSVAARTVSPAAPAAPVAGPHVLVLDRDAETLETVRGLLPAGTRLLHAAELEQALAALAEHDTAVLVADLPPGGEIADALKTLKQYSPRTQTIVAARFADARVLIGLINQGQVFRFLPKPLSRELLRRSLAAALERHADLVRAPEMQQRHAVEAVPGVAPSAGLSTRLLGYWRRIRERNAARA